MQKKKVLFHQDNAPCHKSVKTMVKLCFELLPRPPYSLYLVPSDYWLFAELEKMLQGKRFVSNEEVIVETEAYFESKDESFYKKRIEKLEKRWNEFPRWMRHIIFKVLFNAEHQSGFRLLLSRLV